MSGYRMNEKGCAKKVKPYCRSGGDLTDGFYNASEIAQYYSGGAILKCFGRQKGRKYDSVSVDTTLYSIIGISYRCG